MTVKTAREVPSQDVKTRFPRRRHWSLMIAALVLTAVVQTVREMSALWQGRATDVRSRV